MAVIIKEGKVGKEEKKEVTTWLTRIKNGESFRDADERGTAWKNMKTARSCATARMSMAQGRTARWCFRATACTRG